MAQFNAMRFDTHAKTMNRKPFSTETDNEQ